MGLLDRVYNRKNVKDSGTKVGRPKPVDPWAGIDPEYLKVLRGDRSAAMARFMQGARGRRERCAQAPTLSETNGFIGDEGVYKKMLKLDADLGVGDAIRYVKTQEALNRRGNRVAAYKAEFANRADKNRWLRAHKRHDKDAGYSDPAPGTWQNSTPREFER